MKRTRSSNAFTIVELLVVIAIIGVLMALLLPAVQAARESGRRTACSSNTYQMAMAATRYDQDNKRLVGWKNRVTPTIVASWPVSLLPFIERIDAQEAWIHNLETLAVDPNATPNTSPLRTKPLPSIGVYRCPSASTGIVPALAYAGNCGNQGNGAGASSLPAASKYDGVMIDQTGNLRYSLDDISEGDGLSSTLLFAEKTSALQKKWTGFDMSPSDYTSDPFNDRVRFYTVFSDITMPPVNLLVFKQSSPPGFGIDGSRTNHSDFCMPSSMHPNGGVVAFCDGHTYFLRQDVDLTVYAQLVTSRDSRASLTARNPDPSLTLPNGWNTSNYVLSESDY